MGEETKKTQETRCRWCRRRRRLMLMLCDQGECREGNGGGMGACHPGKPSLEPQFDFGYTVPIHVLPYRRVDRTTVSDSIVVLAGGD